MLASPWKRLAASATDALLILAAHLFLFFCVERFGWSTPDRLKSALFVLSPVACWLYVWFGWWRGATIGKKLCRVRVQSEDGKQLSAAQSALRCAGYAFASVPVKAGLLPILWDARRQGWHDKIARTVVIDASGDASESSPAMPQVERAPRPTAPLLDFSVPRRGWPFALAGYIFCALLLTFPAVLNISTQLIGQEGDSSVFYWNYWFFERAVQNGQPLFSTDLLFYPRGAPLLFHTMNWFNCALAFVLLKVFNLVTTYNLLFFFSLSTSAFAAYWLCAAWTKHRRAAFIAALAFGFSPYFWAHGLGHMNLIAAQFLPVLVLFFYAALTTESRKFAVAAGVALALGGFCDFQMALFAFIWMACLLIGLQFGYAADSALLRRRLKLAAITAATGVLLMAPLLVPALVEQRGASYMNYRQFDFFRATPTDFFRFNALHFLTKPEGRLPTSENIVGIGWAIALLAGFAAWKFHRTQRLWIVSAMVFGVLACGAFIAPPIGSAVVLALGGAPGNGFDLPLDNHRLIALSEEVIRNPQRLVEPHYRLQLPMAWLPQVLPLLKPFRVPARLALGVLLSAAVLAACALAAIGQYAQSRYGKNAAHLVLALMALPVLFEYWPYPYPSFSPREHSFFTQLGRDREKYAIAEAPLFVHQAPMRRQTIHGKPILLGNLSRAPREGFELAATNAILQLLGDDTARWQRRTGPNPARQSWSRALVELRALKVRYIIVHKNQVAAKMQREVTGVLEGELKLPVVLDDDELRVYRL